MDIKGRTSIEYIIMMGLILFMVLAVTSFIGEDNELNMAMAAARSGAIEGANVDSFGIYPKSAFSNYTTQNIRLISPSSIMIRRIDYLNLGTNNTYNRKWIRLKIVASAPSVKNANDRNVLGDRINFHVRKSICEAFSTQNSTNSLFNPVFSKTYVFTTADVKWV